MSEAHEAREGDKESELDVSGLLPDSQNSGVGASQDPSADGDAGCGDPPLLVVVRLLMKSLPSYVLCRVLEAWRLLASISDRDHPLPCGSGCTGSGMDWQTIKTITEALVHVTCSECTSLVVLGVSWLYSILFRAIRENQSLTNSMSGYARDDRCHCPLELRFGGGAG